MEVLRGVLVAWITVSALASTPTPLGQDQQEAGDMSQQQSERGASGGEASLEGPGISADNHRVLDANTAEHEGFPRMVRAADGSLLLFTRLGTSHASDPSSIVLRTSRDGGETWSERREIWRDPAGWCAHNPVAVVAPDGTVILWCSRFDYERNMRNHCVISRSKDNGANWSQFEQFDRSPYRTTYYVTDAIVVEGSILAISTCFTPTAKEPAFNVVWRSDDDGETWREVSQMTARQENVGDEVAIGHLGGDRLVVLQRGRHRDGTYRCYSGDLGKTWSEEENIADQVGRLQRPFLTHLGGSKWLLTGRQADQTPPQVVAYLSVDNCAMFEGPAVIDTYQADGGYTTTVVQPDHTVLMAYYADPDRAGMPDIHLAELDIDGPN